MPKRDEELEYEYEEDDVEELDDDETYAYGDDEEDDDAYDEDDDEEYEDDEDEEPAGGGWQKKAAFVLVGLLVLGGGAYAYMKGMLPFSPKTEEVAQESDSPYANPNGFGKVAPTPGVPSLNEAVPAEGTVPKEAPEPKAPVAEDPKPKAPAKTAEVKVNAEQPALPVAKPQAPAKQPARPAAVAQQPAPQPPKAVTAPAVPAGPGVYAVQCGAFASSANASNLTNLLSAKGFQAWQTSPGSATTGAFSVRSTVVNTKGKADTLKAQFASAGHPGAVVPAGGGRYYLQLGIFSDRSRADVIASELRAKGLFVSVAGGTTRVSTPNRVLVGKFSTMAQAQAMASKVRHQGVPAIVVKL
ncbi:SPOR domain-containing protein [bacterium]|nr:SPOR domain-containing protein [bacterium]